MSEPEPSAQVVEQRMRNRHEACIYVAAGLWFGLAVTFGLHLSAALQVAFVVASLVFVGVTIFGIVLLLRRWRKPVAYMPLAACVSAVLLVAPSVRMLEPAVFRLNESARQALVDRIGAGHLEPGRETQIDLSPNEEWLAYWVAAERTADGTLIVSMATEGAFPVKHAGYVYSSSGSMVQPAWLQKDWPVARPVSPRWFRVRD